MFIDRREFVKDVLACVPLLSGASVNAPPAKFSSKINGVQIAATTYCYRDMRDLTTPWSPAKVDRMMDVLTAAYVEDGINVAEFWIGYVEPVVYNPHVSTSPAVREELRKWRLTRPLSIFERARQKFNAAGVEIYSCIYNYDEKISDEEIEFGFDIAKALGTGIISANCTLPTLRRAAPFAEKHKMRIGAHTENPFYAPDPKAAGGMAVPDIVLAAMKLSPYVDVTLDAGHYVAAGGDPIAFMQEYHDRIVEVHLKDRFKNDPAPHNYDNDLEWGKAQTPIKEILQLMKREHYPFPATIEYEYKGKGTPIEEVRKCYEYAKAALA